MSKPAVLVALLVALALAAAVFLTSPGRTPTPVQASALLELPAGDVREIHVRPAAGPQVRVVPGDGPGQWMLERVDDKGAALPGDRWPIDPAPVRAVLRLLTSAGTVGDAPAPPAEAARVRFVLASGQAVELAIDANPVAGRVAARVQPAPPASARAGWLPAEVADALLRPGPSAWEKPAALPGLGPDTSRIEIRAGPQRLELRRQSGRWALTHPIAEPADPQAVEGLLKSLAAVRLAGPADTGADEAFPATPGATIVVGFERRRLVGDAARTDRVEDVIDIGPAAELGGKAVLARLSRLVRADAADSAATTVTAWSRLALLPTDRLDAATPDPLAYVSRRLLPVPPADVSEIILRSAADATLSGGPADPGRFYAPLPPVSAIDDAVPAFRRNIRSWTRRGAPVPADAPALDALARLLTEREADRLLTVAPPGVEPLALVDMRGTSGTPLAAVLVALAPAAQPGEPPPLVVSTGRLWRVYAAEPALIDWLRSPR